LHTPVVVAHSADLSPIPIILVNKDTLAEQLKSFGATSWAQVNGFEGGEGEYLLLPSSSKAGAAAVLINVGTKDSHLALAGLQGRLPEGDYALEKADAEIEQKTALFWALNAYQFGRYNGKQTHLARLVCGEGVDLAAIAREVEAVFLGRDLINIPANDLGTVELTEAIIALGEKYGARVSVISGEDLLVQNFPLIHAVGRASPRAPALVDLTWGDESHPKITLVGKGIVFDTGGLDLKPSAAMLLMKKDMGGSAATIATASMIMAAKLPVRLRLLVPTAENSVSGNAFRPGDVLPSRKGLSVEIGNTDAEGRLVLADALALADEEAPELIVSFATLTGAARVALGPDLPPIYATDTAIGAKLQAVGDLVGDPMWQMPLYPPYAKMLSSEIADINHVSQGGFAGSITAALFLARFVEKASYVHLDIYGWNPSARPGVPKGGEVHCARALFHYLEEKYRP